MCIDPTKQYDSIQYGDSVQFVGAIQLNCRVRACDARSCCKRLSVRNATIYIYIYTYMKLWTRRLN